MVVCGPSSLVVVVVVVHHLLVPPGAAVEVGGVDVGDLLDGGHYGREVGHAADADAAAAAAPAPASGGGRGGRRRRPCVRAAVDDPDAAAVRPGHQDVVLACDGQDESLFFLLFLKKKLQVRT